MTRDHLVREQKSLQASDVGVVKGECPKPVYLILGEVLIWERERPRRPTLESPPSCEHTRLGQEFFFLVPKGYPFPRRILQVITFTCRISSLQSRLNAIQLKGWQLDMDFLNRPQLMHIDVVRRGKTK